MESSLGLAADLSGQAMLVNPLLQKGRQWNGGFVVRRDWTLLGVVNRPPFFQKLYRSEDPAKRSSQTEGNVS
jgi:hypothetical protein